LPFEQLKHRFIDLTQVAFLVGQGAENVFKVPWKHLQHTYIDFIQVAIWDGQEAENVSKCHSTTSNVIFSKSNKSYFGMV